MSKLSAAIVLVLLAVVAGRGAVAGGPQRATAARSAAGGSSSATTPYQFNASPQCQGPTCTATTPGVPAGMRLVVQHVSASSFLAPLNKAGTYLQVFIVNANGPDFLSGFTAPLVGKGRFFGFDEPVLGYVDAGGAINFTLATDGDFTGTAPIFVISGYLIDCTANSCPTIAP